MLTHFSLFSGIGGADLASEWAGFKTIGQVEWADYPTKVLEKHWPHVPRWRDIRDVSSDNVRRIIGETPITVISGGFPCQPFSVAGKRKGKDDDRFLWPEMLRVISELKPAWVIGENVAGFVNMALEEACSDLESQGYEVQPFLIPACGIGAWHKRERVFIVAYSQHARRNATEAIRENNGTKQKEQAGQELLFNEFERISSIRSTTNNVRRTDTIFQDTRCELRKRCKQLGKVSNENRKRDADFIKRPSEMVPDTNGTGLQRSKEAGNAFECRTNINKLIAGCNSFFSIWESEPNVGRVANGIPSRVDRLKCLGNAIVPQQIYPIFQAIADIETNNN